MEERKVGDKSQYRDFEIEYRQLDRESDKRYRIMKRKKWRDYFS